MKQTHASKPIANSGQAIRDAQLDFFEVRDADFLDRCRTVAAAVARSHGAVSINDVRARVEVPPGMHPSVLGAVFRNRSFRRIGFTEASHPEAHARVVRVYALSEVA